MPLHQVFFYLLLVALPTQLGKHFWPEWALVLGRRVDYLSPTLYGTDVLIVLLVLFWFIDWFIRIKKKELRMKDLRIRNQRKTFILSSLFLMLALYVWANITYAASQPVALYHWLKVLEYSLLGLYVIKTKPRFSSIVMALSIAVFYSSVIAMFQFLFQHSIGGPFWFLGERTFSIDTPGISRIHIYREMLRVYGTFPHPNVLGGFLAAVLPLLLFQISESKKQKTKLFYGVSLVTGVIALCLTFSRSAWIVGGLAIAVAIVRIKNYELRIKGKILLVLFFILTSSFLILIQPIRPTDESVVVRQQLNMSAITLWQRSPIVGIGLGNFLVNLPHALPSRQIYFLQPVHNIYLLLLSEVGVVGVIVCIWFIVYIIKYVELRSKNKELRYHPFILISLFTILALGLVDHYPLTLQQGQLLLTVVLSLSFIHTS